MSVIQALRGALGEDRVLTGDDMAAWSTDWTGRYRWTPLCVVRPGSTKEVCAVMRIAHAAAVPVVPVSGHTGLAGGTHGDGAVMLSLERLNAIEEIRPEARVAVVGAGVVLSALHEAAEAQGLSFPMTFGARGSARIGGLLATNAGGSNVLRYGNTRDLVLGLEAVTAEGRVLDLMTALHKNNAGYDLRHLLIGSEGTLAVITRAVLKLVRRPRAHATAMVAARSVSEALVLLNRLQDVTSGAVEAFEYMPAAYMDTYLALHPEARAPFDSPQAVNILLELGVTSPRDSTPGEDGLVPVVAALQEALVDLLEQGLVLDAVVAHSEAQRAEMWARREAAAEVSLSRGSALVNDVAVPLDAVEAFLTEAGARCRALDPDVQEMVVAHLGDGNVHYALWPSGAAEGGALVEAVEEVVRALGGSFSAEHGIGLHKKASMARHRDPVALEVMRAVKTALDPKGILNPGKVLP